MKSTLHKSMRDYYRAQPLADYQYWAHIVSSRGELPLVRFDES